MTYSTCPHELPRHQWRKGRFCRQGDGCRYPDCVRTNESSTPLESTENGTSELSDSDPPARVSGDLTPKERGAIATCDQNGAKLSDSTDCERVWQRTGIYQSKGVDYYRYQWGVGHEVKETIHIPGGNRFNPVAQSRAFRVYKAIHWEGKSVEQVKWLISPWQGHRAKL